MRRALVPVLLSVLLSGQANSELVVSVGHAGTPSLAVFAGPYLATASWSNVALIDLVSGLTVAQLPHASLVDSMDVNPAGDLLAVGTCDRSIQLWDLRTRKVSRTIALKRECAESVAFSPDGAFLATGQYGCCKRGGIQVWDVRTGAAAREFETSAGIRHVLFARTGKWLVGVDADGVAHLFEWPSGTLLRSFKELDFSGSEAPASSSPDGRYLAWRGGHDITVWDTSTGAQVPLPGVRAATVQDFPPNGPTRQWTEMVVDAFATEFLDDGRLAYVNEHGLVLARLPDGPFETIPIPPVRSEWHGHVGIAMPREWLRIRRDGMAIALVDESRTMLWDTTARRFREFTSPALTQPASLQWSRSGLIAWADLSSGAHAWDDARGELVSLAPGNTLTFDSTGSRLATIDFSGLHIVDVETRRTLRSVELPNVFDASVAFSPDGSRLVAELDGGLALFDASLKQQKVFHKLPEYTSLERVAFSPDGRWIAAGLSGPKPALQVFPGAGGDPVVTLDTADVTYGSQPPAFSSDAKWLASFTKGKVLTVWSTTTWKVERTWELPHNGDALAFAPSGSRLAIAGNRESAIWDASSGRKLVTFTSPGSSNATGIAWSPDGARVVTAADDGVLRFWSALDGRLLASLYTFSANRDWLLVAPDGRIDGTESALRDVVAWRTGDKVARDAAQTARRRVRGLWRVLSSAAR